MSGLYIHIPFCQDKCTYCDFFSGNQLYMVDNYVDALCREIELRSNYLEDKEVGTIYFGGGTPSILNERQIGKILKQIVKYFVVRSEAEITLECNPEDVNEVFLKGLGEIGINRISLGIQFLEDDILSQFNRKHSKALIYSALRCLEKSTVKNLSVDLIYSVPGVDNASLLATLESLCKFNILHFSAYSLTIARNSKLFWKIQSGEFVENVENEFLKQYSTVYDFLTSKGYIQYELSNYAKDGFISLHNLGYWNQIPYLGIGVSAHSYNGISRQWNHTNIKKYIRELEGGILNIEIEHLTENQIFNEYIILKLRTLQGISQSYIKRVFREEIQSTFAFRISKLIKKGHFISDSDLIVPRQSDLLIADYLAKDLMI